MNPVISVPLAYLKDSDHNPPNRVKRENLTALMESMDVFGLFYPVLMDKNKVIIEGHRRVAAARLLGWSNIDCRVIEGDVNAIYASINVTAKKMGSNDIIGVWLKNPLAVMPRHRAKLQKMAEHIGLPLVKRIYGLGYSMAVYKTALQICKYCGTEDTEDIKSTVTWLIEMPVMGDVRRAIAIGESPKIIMKAIRAKKPIKFRLSIGDES